MKCFMFASIKSNFFVWFISLHEENEVTGGGKSKKLWNGCVGKKRVFLQNNKQPGPTERRWTVSINSVSINRHLPDKGGRRWFLNSSYLLFRPDWDGQKSLAYCEGKILRRRTIGHLGGGKMGNEEIEKHWLTTCLGANVGNSAFGRHHLFRATPQRTNPISGDCACKFWQFGLKAEVPKCVSGARGVCNQTKGFGRKAHEIEFF